MKIFLISDTHGEIDKVREVYEKLRDIDLIIHCGDYEYDAIDLEDLLGAKIVYVKGNCDGATKLDRKIVETPYGKIMVTHGHLDGAGFDENRLVYLAEENDCVCTCFGHTHVPMNEKCGSIRLVNPGSLTSPRDGSAGSYGIIHATEEDFHVNIVYYEPPAIVQPKKKKVQGGYLRGLLNYSDRF